ncbi:TetR family transcriptional regulator [Pseudonocardia sulfidoxydans NBRC 16205]|uniref:TetR family transcriptional regulator n=1 Tax=Pseudonocardia sulfidoxydans NBRC 16205 TaxID=1223511 RepID=A0A511DAS7_9PSEU|nr:TetR/AcrR family transcriptional regulator [Pseudonocardia sulfidoxydans]GEL21909.1 TetR family transcriptional regulator [Pseudonocardia sulfidoxydans NBRC 16205]
MAAGTREQKKARARAAMAAAAADLFGTHGFTDVTMAQIARAAGVSDQTLYNYFPTKESLVFDQAGAFETTLLHALADRPPGSDPVDAFARWFDAFLLGEAAERGLANPGGMIRLVSGSDTLHRTLLAFAHRVAGRAAAVLDDDASTPTATVLADAMLAVVVRVFDALGSAHDASDVGDITARAHAAVEALRPLAAGLPTGSPARPPGRA